MTSNEIKLQELWASVLGTDAGNIAAGDSFLHLGDDPIQAMRLVAATRDAGMKLTVAEILGHPTLEKQAKYMTKADRSGIGDLRPLGLLDSATSDCARADDARILTVDTRVITNILPCTALH